MRYDRPYKKERRKESGRWMGSTFKMTTMEKETETLKSCRVFFWFQLFTKLPYVTIDHKDERCDSTRAQRCHRRRRRRRRRAFAFRAIVTGKEESPPLPSK